MEFHFISWHYCLLFFIKVAFEKLLLGIIFETPFCYMVISLLILSMEWCGSEGFWGQVSWGRGACFMVKCVAGQSKHSCKEKGISKPMFFSHTSSSGENVCKLKSNLVRILFQLELLPDIAEKVQNYASSKHESKMCAMFQRRRLIFFLPQGGLGGKKGEGRGTKECSHYLRA